MKTITYGEFCHAAVESFKAMCKAANKPCHSVQLRLTGGTAAVGPLGGDASSGIWLLTMPGIPVTKRLTRDQADRLTGLWAHEALHVIYTDFDAWREAVAKRVHKLVNGLEDCRIEHLGAKHCDAVNIKACVATVLASFIRRGELAGQPYDPRAKAALPFTLAIYGRVVHMGYDVYGCPSFDGLTAGQRALVDRATRDAIKARDTWAVLKIALDLKAALEADDDEADDERDDEPRERGRERGDERGDERDDEPGDERGDEGDEGDDGEGDDGEGEGDEGDDGDERGDEGDDGEGDDGEGDDGEGDDGEGEGDDGEGEGDDGEGDDEGEGEGEGSDDDGTDGANNKRHDGDEVGGDGASGGAVEGDLADWAGETDDATLDDGTLDVSDATDPREPATRSHATVANYRGYTCQSIAMVSPRLSNEVRKAVRAMGKADHERHMRAGRFDCRAISRAMTGGDDVFAKRSFTDDDVASCLILIDISSSMAGYEIAAATKMAQALGDALAAAGAPFAIAGYADPTNAEYNFQTGGYMPGCTLLFAKAFNEAWAARKTKVTKLRGMCNYGTQIMPAILAGTDILLKGPTATKRVLFILTDGEDNYGVGPAGLAAKMAHDKGVIVCALGVGTDASHIVAHTDPALAVKVNDLADLEAGAFKVMGEAIAKA